jgi:radical SAM protein with 4Fe4S-binding SPASM domain
MEVSLTDRCNLKCKWCIAENRGNSTQSLEIKHLLQFISDFKRLGGKALTFSGGGEPTLYPFFKEATIEAVKNNVDIGLMTNGLFQNNLIETIGNNFKWVRISLDTLNNETYKRCKGVDAVSTVVENIKELRKFKCKVGINCNVGKDTTVEDVKEIIGRLEDYSNYIQFRPILPRYFKDESIELNDVVWNFLKEVDHPKVNISIDKFKDLSTQNRFSFKSCEGHFFSPILNSNGDIKICMYHPTDKLFSFGNIHEKTFEEIWKSEQRKKVIDHIRKLNYKENCQLGCKLCELNKFIDFIKNTNKDKLDINFL